ncbi:hypothetical protein GA0070216_108161 [Micromonospora matsumotoense]|uniref:Uncharacterized protein n=1 Tax=Micromonospora matsumotoense TaxID=121616 RepID=A0A1C4Z520_9ACTN|nr:hypothetical protein GA0070216_108161 [Micromonospora matsumotoense]
MRWPAATCSGCGTAWSLLPPTPLRGEGQRGFRQLRSELKMIPALPVALLRGQADDLARQLREVDTLIQRTNWEVDLLD